MVGMYKFTLSKPGWQAYQFTKSFSRNLTSSLYGLHQQAKEVLKDGVYTYISTSVPAGRTYEVVSRFVGRTTRKMTSAHKTRYPYQQESVVRTMTNNYSSKGQNKTRKVSQYERNDVFYNHTASAPGQPPAIMSGDLVKSIITKGNNSDTFSIGSTSFYGSIFEGHPSQHNLTGGGVYVGGPFGGLSAGRYVSATMNHNFGAGSGNSSLLKKHVGKTKALYGTRPFIAPVLKSKRAFLRDLYTTAIGKFIGRYGFR